MRNAELAPGFRRYQEGAIKGSRTRHVVTFNPNRAGPGETIYVTIPRLGPDYCLVPDTLSLNFKFKNSNAKSWFNNNLGRLLQERLVIKLSGSELYHNTGESLWGVYKD